MNVLISYNWLKEYLPGLKASPEQVAEKLSLHSFSVEKIWRTDDFLDGVVVGEILEFHKHPNADKLSVAKVDVGKGRPIQLIFGQMVKMKAGDRVPVAVAPTLLPGGKKIEKAKLRGELSEGMLCVDQELGLAETGLNIRYFDKTVPTGTLAAKALGLDDTIMEIEITTNRPDAAGVIGIAREVGAIFNVDLKVDLVKLKSKKSSVPLTIQIDEPKLCPRYIAVVMDNIEVKESPWWMQRKLIASGLRPINNLVDITNYVLLEYGRPSHVFDYDKISGRKIIVRKGRKGEKMLALNNNVYNIDEDILVIADSKGPIDIGGIMGGEETGAHQDTKKIVFELANFDAVAIRKGEQKLALASDASARFNKGLPSELVEYGGARIVELTQHLAGGRVLSVIDKKFEKSKPIKISIKPKEIQRIIGADIPINQMKTYLKRLGFQVSGSSNWKVEFPYWRFLDSDGPEDIAEEIARMYGYHLLPAVLPEGDLLKEVPDSRFRNEFSIKQILRGAGFTELYTYSFVSQNDLDLAGFENAVSVSNPLTSDLTHMRPWLGISILNAIKRNQAAKDNLNLFELSNEYLPNKGLPKERQKLIVSVSGQEAFEGENFFKIKGLAEHLADSLGLPRLSFETAIQSPWIKNYHPGRVLVCRSKGDILGIVGEVHPALSAKFGINERVAFLEWEVEVLLPLVGVGKTYIAPLKYPVVKRDVSFVVSKEVRYKDILETIVGIDALVYNADLFDQYSKVREGFQSLAFHISYADNNRTLLSEEVDKVHDKLIKKLTKDFNIEIR